MCAIAINLIVFILLWQLIQLISNLMDALKMSFSQRSSNARSLGNKDPLSDAAVATVTIMKVFDIHTTYY